MNLSPSRHPAFIAIACLSLFAAWSTPEAEVIALDAPSRGGLALSEAMPPLYKAPLSLEADCIGRGGAQRALCVFSATRSGEAITALAAVNANGNRSPQPVRVAAQNPVPSASPAAHKSYRDDRARLDHSVLIR